MSEPDRYAVIGQPVAHSRSPFIHARFARQCGQSLVYSTIECSPDRFVQVAKQFFAAGGKGLNVTAPHKEAALLLATQLTPRAARAAAVNTLAMLTDGSLLGDNTDGEGLIRDLTANLGVALAGRRILLLGAGGAARGVIAPLLQQRPALLVIANRTPARAEALARQFSDLGPVRAGGYDSLREALDAIAADVVVNATAASLAGELPPLPPGCVDAKSFCYDMAYAGKDTPFMSWARDAGVTRMSMGLGMLVEQAAESFLLWRGVRPETAGVLAELTAASRD